MISESKKTKEIHPLFKTNVDFKFNPFQSDSNIICLTPKIPLSSFISVLVPTIISFGMPQALIEFIRAKPQICNHQYLLSKFLIHYFAIFMFFFVRYLNLR